MKRAEKTKLMRCSKCGRAIKFYSNKGMCMPCINSIWNRNHREKLKKEGKCIDCGKPHDTTFVRCPKCKLNNSRKRNEN
jgi:NMD protein affecting ribosome stability and mRNA decay